MLFVFPARSLTLAAGMPGIIVPIPTTLLATNLKFRSSPQLFKVQVRVVPPPVPVLAISEVAKVEGLIASENVTL